MESRCESVTRLKFWVTGYRPIRGTNWAVEKREFWPDRTFYTGCGLKTWHMIMSKTGRPRWNWGRIISNILSVNLATLLRAWRARCRKLRSSWCILQGSHLVPGQGNFQSMTQESGKFILEALSSLISV